MILYKITGPFEKVYIGVTNSSLKRRMQGHKSRALTSNRPIYKEIRKYGFNRFVSKEVCVGKDESYIHDLESHLIKSYKENGRSYNLSEYKTGCFKRTDDQKEFFKKVVMQKGKEAKINKRRWFIVEYKDGTFFGRFNTKEACALSLGLTHNTIYKYFRVKNTNKTFNFRYEEV